jgi:drug/metabolite transporter (DMT)-like permease
MTLAVVLSLSAALCWGTAGFTGGLQSRQLPPLTVALWSQIAGATVLVVVLLVRGQTPAPASVGWGVGAGLVGAIALLLFYQALATGPMSLVAPVSACGVVVPVLVALGMGEVPSTPAIAGIAAVIIGIILVSLHPGPTLHGAGHVQTALVFALGAALGFGMFFVFLDRGSAGLSASPLWAVGGARFSLLATLLALSTVRRPAVRWPGHRIGAVVAIGLADTTGNALFAYASTQGNLGVVAVLGSLYPVVTVLLGRIILAERLAPVQHAGVVLALAGVALLASG